MNWGDLPVCLSSTGIISTCRHDCLPLWRWVWGIKIGPLWFQVLYQLRSPQNSSLHKPIPYESAFNSCEPLISRAFDFHSVSRAKEGPIARLECPVHFFFCCSHFGEIKISKCSWHVTNSLLKETCHKQWIFALLIEMLFTKLRVIWSWTHLDGFYFGVCVCVSVRLYEYGHPCEGWRSMPSIFPLSLHSTSHWIWSLLIG